MPLPIVDPPLINTANPWATTAEDLQKLFDCPHTGAVTTRTSLLHGFEHNPAVHQYAFFNPQDLSSKPASSDGEVPAEASASLNTLGMSLSHDRTVSECSSAGSKLLVAESCAFQITC